MRYRLSDDSTQISDNKVKLDLTDTTLSILDEFYRINPETGISVKSEIVNKPNNRFGHGVFKLGPTVIYALGGVLDKKLININNIPLLTNFPSSLLVKDLGDSTNYLNNFTICDGSSGFESYFSDKTGNFDFGIDNTAGEDG